MATRNEVIYQSIALFSSAITGDALEGVPSGAISGLQRVTDINWGGEVARQDINCMGKLAAVSREIIEEPTVNLDFTYYLANGFNEAAMGLSVFGRNAYEETNLISGVLADSFGLSEKNYYILTVAQGEDADNVDLGLAANTGYGVIGIGNAFMSDYTVNLAVGDIPNAAVSFDAANLTFTNVSGTTMVTDPLGGLGFRNPGIKRADETDLSNLQFSGRVQLPTFHSNSSTGTVDLHQAAAVSVAALRPGDIVVNFDTATLAAGGAVIPGNTVESFKQSAHVQSVSINVPLSRTPLTRLGNPFAFARKIDVPINTSITVGANVGDITTGSLVNLLCNDDPSREIQVTLGSRCGGPDNMVFKIKGAQLDSQSMSINIGDSETVDLTFTAQIGGYNDTTKGVFISGLEPTGNIWV